MQRTTTSAAAIEVRGLRKSYGPREVLHGLDLTVRTGEVFCLLGPNGAGKTTTVEILEGYRRAAPARSRCSATTPSAASARCASGSAIVLQACGRAARR